MSPFHDQCSWITSQLPLFLDGELPEELMQGVGRHLDGCSSCRQALQQEISLVETTVSALVTAEPSETLSHRVGSALRQQAPSKAQPVATRSWMTWVNSIAAAILLCVGVGFVIISMGPTSSDEPVLQAARKQLNPRKNPSTTAPRPTDQSRTVTTTEVDAPPAEPEDAERFENSDAHEAVVIHEVVLGDLNADGELTLADLSLFLRAIEQDHFETIPCAAAGDFDGDQQLTPADSVLASRSLGFSGGAPAPRHMIEIATNGPLTCQVSACP